MHKTDCPAIDSGGAESAGAAIYSLLSTALRRIPRDMSLTAASTLGTIERTGPRRITDLAIIEGVSQPTMTSLVVSLERDRLVERRADASDGRVVLISITTVGRRFLRARRKSGTSDFADLISMLPQDEARALIKATSALVRLRELDNHLRDPST